MSFPESTIRKMDRRLQRIGAPVPPGHWELDIKIKQREWNGIGSDSGNLKYLVAPANIFLSWMLAASLPHDEYWGIFNDGTRETFERSNNEWKDICYKLADDSFGWIPFKGIRDTLRNARKFEARRGWKILMSDDCWKVFQESAQINEGPEVQMTMALGISDKQAGSA